MKWGTRDVQCRTFLETLVKPVSSSTHSKVQSQPLLDDFPSIPNLEFDFIKRTNRISHNTLFIYFLSYYPQITLSFANIGVVVNFMCQLDWAMGCPDT